MLLFVLPSATVSYEELSSLKIGISPFIGSFSDSGTVVLSCAENMVESIVPLSVSAENVLPY